MRSQAVTVISTYLGNLAREFGYAGNPVLVPNGVDVSRFSKSFEAKEIEEARAKLGKKEGDIYLVTTSRLVHKNAVDDVIRALPSLPLNISFLIYGVGPDEGKLKTLARELGVAERARFMGQASHTELPHILASCDIFIRPSRSEGMGNSFIEAMAAGLPVIATQEGGIADFLFDAKRNPGVAPTGYAVDKDSPQQIVEAVGRILANPEVAYRVAQSGKALAISRYGWDRIAGEMKAVFHRLVG
jgi:glycosyltransferase involved in cell wall biosynthesis